MLHLQNQTIWRREDSAHKASVEEVISQSAIHKYRSVYRYIMTTSQHRKSVDGHLD